MGGLTGEDVRNLIVILLENAYSIGMLLLLASISVIYFIV